MFGNKPLTSMTIAGIVWVLASAVLCPSLQAAEPPIMERVAPLRLAQRDEEPSGVRVPDVRGRNITQAEAVILREGLSPGRMTPQDSDSPDGTVLRQDPAPGQQVQRGTPVRLWFARRSVARGVPSVIGHPVWEAERILQEADLRMREGGRERSDRPEDTVVRQEPGPGGFRPPDAIVTVWLAVPDLITVPNLVGESVETAPALLGRSLRLGQQSMRPSETHEGLIVEQSPPAGTMLPHGGTVDVVIGSGGLVRVPRVVGGHQAAAVGRLDDSGLRVGRVVSEASSRRPGTVIRQRPPEGSLARRGSAVDIWMAVAAPGDGRPSPPWPWLIGAAAALLGAVGWWWSRRRGSRKRAATAGEPQVRVHIEEIEIRTSDPLPLDRQMPEIRIRARLLRGDAVITTEDLVVREERRTR